ncbi:MAG: hypothetical protein Crog4KO_09950 [Crocinitomicaceae bacterium]
MNLDLKKVMALCGVLILSQFINAQNFNRPTPNEYNQYEFQRYDSTLTDYYYLVAPYYHKGPTLATAQKALYVLDEDGYIAWMTQDENKHFDFKYHPNVNRYSFARRNQGVRLHYELNEQFEMVDSTFTINGVNGDIHELQIFPNGNRCILGTQPHYNVDLSGYTFYNGDVGTTNNTVVGAVIQEFDTNGNLVFEWDSFNHLTPDYFASGPYNPNNFDYVHANAIALDTTDNNLLVSFKTANLVCKIDHVTGNVIWRLNGNFSDFTFPNDNGFSGQHDIRLLPNGNVSIFDNDYGNDAPRGVEYSLDMNNMEATKVQEWPYWFNFYSNSLGSFRRITDGYHLVCWGNTRRPQPSVTLFDENFDIATDLFFEDTIVSYRAFMQKLPNFPTRPEIQCEMVGDSMLLSVSGTHNYYAWSTGELTSSITVSQAGEYQCWVDYGIGMLGSYPISIDDITACSLNSIQEIEWEGETQRIYFDLLGRIVDLPEPGQMYIVYTIDAAGKISISKEIVAP